MSHEEPDNSKKTILDTIMSAWGSTLDKVTDPEITIKSDHNQEDQTILGDNFGKEKSTTSGETIADKNTVNKDLVNDGTIIDEKHQETKNPISFASNDFELRNEIGRGGMGVVYNAYQKSLNREVALKVIAPKRDQSEMKKRFISEAIITADLDHPNIVPVHLLNEDSSGNISIAMKKLSGVSWNRLLRPKTEEEKKQAESITFLDHLDILIKVSDAVAFAHAHNVIHRDLKPENIMIGKFGEVFVMDWGIAINISETPNNKIVNRSQIKSPEGTPAYMAPEMALNQTDKLDVTTDIYLMGSILYEILVGKPPHHGSSILEILVNASQEKEMNFNIDAPEEIIQILKKAMTYNPRDRYQDIVSFKRELQNFIKCYDAMRIVDDLNREMKDLKNANIWTNRDVYITGDHIYNGLEQVLKIIPNNQKALNTILEITELQIDWALKHEDIVMVETYISRLKSLPSLPEGLLESVHEKKKSVQGFRRGILSSLVVFIFVFAIFYYTKNYIEEENNKELQAQSKIQYDQQIWQDFREAQKDPSIKKIVELSQSLRKKNVNVPIRELRLNESMNHLQLGNYEEASTLLREEIKDRELKENIDYSKIKALSTIDPEFFKTSRESHFCSDSFQNICELAQNGWVSSAQLQKIWEETYTNFVVDKDDLLFKLTIANILCFAVEVDTMQNQKWAEETIKFILELELPFYFWNLYLAKPNYSPHSISSYISEYPLKIQKRKNGLFVLNQQNQSLWRFPPQNKYSSTSNFLFFPEKKVIYWISDSLLIGLEAHSGKIVEQYHLHRQLTYLARYDKNSFSVEGACSYNKLQDESEKVVFNIQEKKFDKKFISDVNPMSNYKRHNNTKIFFKDAGIEIFDFLSAQSPWSVDNFKKEELEPLVEQLITLNPKNDFNHLIKAFLLRKIEKKQEGDAIIEKIIKNDDNLIFEWVVFGVYCDLLGAQDWKNKFYHRLKEDQVNTYYNPNMAVSLISTPSFLLKKIAEDCFKNGQQQKALSILKDIRRFFYYTEGDTYTYSGLSTWANQNGNFELVREFQQHIDLAQKNGGDLIASNKYILIADFIIFFTLLSFAFIFCLISYFWYRARKSRIHDLESIGYYNVFLRNMAFLANPFKRLRYTFVSYLNLGEKLSLIFIIFCLIISNVIFASIVSRIGVIAALPIEIGNGYIGGYTSLLYLEQNKDDIIPLNYNLLIAEGNLQRKNFVEAQQQWENISSHPIASNNLGCLYSSTDKNKAYKYFKDTVQNGNLVQQQIAQINLEILEKGKITTLDTESLPEFYKRHLDIAPNKMIFLFCDYGVLEKCLIGNQNIFNDVVKFIFSSGESLTSMSIILDENFFFPIAIWYKLTSSSLIFAIVVVVFLVSFLTPIRPLQKNSLFIKEINGLLKVLKYFFPGILWLLKRQGIRTTFFCLTTISCICVFLMYYYDGGTLSSIAVPVYPFSNLMSSFMPAIVNTMFYICILAFIIMWAISIRRDILDKQ